MVSGSTIASALADDLRSAFTSEDGARRLVVLWLDVESHYRRVVAAVDQQLAAAGIAVLDGGAGRGQFALKAAVTRAELERRRTVVYLPGFGLDDLRAKPDGKPPGLWGLVEYRYKGCVWGLTKAGEPLPEPLTIDRWLQSHGARLSGGPTRQALLSGGPDSPLSRLVGRMASRSLDALPDPLNTKSVEEALAGSPRDRIIDLIIDPERALARWGDERAEVAHSLSESFGLAAKPSPSDWCDEVCVQLALTEAWDSMGRGDGFPFEVRLPATSDQRDACVALIREHLLVRSDVSNRIRTVVAQRGDEFAAIEGWAGDRVGIPVLLPAVGERRVARILENVGKVLAESGPRKAAQTLGSLLPESQAADHEPEGIRVLRQLNELSLLIGIQRESAGTAKSAAELMSHQATTWYEIDRRYLGVYALCREDPELRGGGHLGRAAVHRLHRGHE